MKIAILFYAPFPWNRGIHLVASALREAGHDVVVYCPEGRVGESSDTSVPVVRRSRGALPVYIDVVWLFWLARRMRRDGVDVVWTRDLPLMPFAIVAGRLLRRPVCFDMRENFPAAYVARRGSIGVGERIIHAVLKAVERVCIRLSDHVFVVVEEQKERLVAMGVAAERVSVNMTTPDSDFLASCPAPITGGPGISAVYAGHFFAFRGLGMVLEAVAEARRRGARVHLTIAGGGGRGDDERRDELLDQTRALGIEDAVNVAGWIDPRNLPAFLAEFDVGLITNELSEHTETTIPGKLFEYMACGLMVISSDLAPVRRIVEREQVGYVFRPYAVEALAERLVLVAGMTPEGRLAIRLRGWRAARDQYNWHRQSRALVKAVAHLAADA